MSKIIEISRADGLAAERYLASDVSEAGICGVRRICEDRRDGYWQAHQMQLMQLGFMANRADADGDTLYLARDLEQVSAETLDVLRFPLIGRQVLPFVNELTPGADTWAYDMYNVASKAEWISNWATIVGNTGAGKTRVSLRPRYFGNSYQYTMADLERAAMARGKLASNRALDAEEARGCRLGHEQFLDTLVWDGDASRNMPGLPGILEAAGFSIGDFADISTAKGAEVQVPYLRPSHKLYTSGAFTGTGPQVVEALTELVLSIGLNTGGGVKANKVLLPLSFQIRMRQPYSNSILDGKTIEKVFLDNNPGVTIDYVYPLDSKSAVSGSPGGRAMAMFQAPQTAKFVLAYDFKELPVQVTGMAYTIPTIAFVLGVVSQRPLQMAQMDLDDETNA
jgi:hypothetical protein